MTFAGSRTLVLRSVLILFAPILALAVLWMPGRETAARETPVGQEPSESGEPGIPVKSQLVISRCGSCHSLDEKNRLSRISYQRRTPEGWESAIKRMVRLNGLSVTPDEARQIVKYLSKEHGLSPEESRATFYEAERRTLEEKVPDENVRTSCMLCHSLGRAASQRRTREEWQLLVNLHVGLFPLVSTQGFYRFDLPAGLPEPPGSDRRHPSDAAVEYLANTYPLVTPEWQSWSAGIRSPMLVGRWLINGYQAGRGRIVGELTVQPTAVEDEFITRIEARNLKDGSSWIRTGRSVVYGGHSWRGRSTGDGRNGPESIREVMLVSRDWSVMEGRWFWGNYDEFGFDVTVRRVASEPVVAVVDRPAVRASAAPQQITVYGANFPIDLKIGEITFGPGITTKRIISNRADAITLEIIVSADAPNGLRDISMRHSVATGVIAVFDKVDYMKVQPNAGLARVGGSKYPKQFQQFEAVGYNRGPDGQAETADDINLGPQDVDWAIEEFPGNYFDDDKDFIGTIDRNGLFTPGLEGPNPARHNSRNNSGEVWVVATRKPQAGDTDAATLKARSYLVVTLPLYIRWDTPEISR